MHKRLESSMPTEAFHTPARKTVRFAIYPDGFEGPRISAEITECALCEIYGSNDSVDDLIACYRANFVEIQMIALKRHHRSPSVAICLEKEDFQETQLNCTTTSTT